MQNENEIQTATGDNVSALEDLTLNGAAAAQVKGGAASAPQGQLYLGTDQGVYRKGSSSTFTLTFNGQTSASSVFGQPVIFTATVQPS